MNQKSSTDSSLSSSSAEAISRRAYELWEQEGRPDGNDMRHWLQAEKEISGNQEGSTSSDTSRYTDQPASRPPTAESRSASQQNRGTRPATPTPPSRDAKRPGSYAPEKAGTNGGAVAGRRT